MKKVILIICILTLPLYVVAQSTKFKIMALNTPTITIGNRNCKVESVFDGKEEIKWSSKEQSMFVKNLDKGTYHNLLAEAFSSRKSKSVFQYFYTKKASTRENGFSTIISRNPMIVGVDKRIALVVGNSNYESERNLYTPIADALTVSNTLSQLGFNVYVLFDANKKEMDDAIKKFSSFSSNYETALIYYAGHGMQFGDDVYLLPTDSHIETSYDVTVNCVPTKRIISFLNDVQTLQRRMIFIDACRSEPQLLQTRGKEDYYLFATNELKDGIIVFSTKHGYVAYDESLYQSENSPFTSAFVDNIVKPNVSVNDFITDLMSEVKSITSNPPYPNPQEPRPIITLAQRFYFNPEKNHTFQESLAAVERISNERSLNSHSSLREISFSSPENPEEFYELGLAYYKDSLYKEAVSVFLKSAAKDYTAAFAMLGDCYSEGHGVNKDYYIAKSYYEKAAEKGYPRALKGLADMYFRGKGVKKNIKKSLKYFEKAAEIGDESSQFWLGVSNLFGEGIAQNEQKGVYWLDKLSENDEPVYKYCVGVVYSIYNYILSNSNNEYNPNKEYYKKAFKLYSITAKKGMPEAQWLLAKCYEDGVGIEKNEKEAEYWYTKSANQNYLEAEKSLAALYSFSSNGLSDDKKAFYWYEKAANHGDSWAQYWLGEFYLDGKGVDESKVQAAVWFEKAAISGFDCAIERIGECYYYGEGVAQDYKKAIMWFEKIAETGWCNVNRARKHLVECYEKGLGVEKNEEKAKYWQSKVMDEIEDYD